jgi:hypothetical protein
MAEEAEAALTPEHRALYAKHLSGFKKTIPGSQKLAVPAEKVSAVVEEALPPVGPAPGTSSVSVPNCRWH